VSEVHEFSMRELLVSRHVLDLDDIRLMACHFMRGLHVRHQREFCASVFMRVCVCVCVRLCVCVCVC
jgi:hypothetical protein